MIPLEEKIGYHFSDQPLLQLALTHPSYRHERKSVGEDNQRLEFLGDAVLGLVTAEYLYHTYRTRDEGTLTPYRSRMTSKQALAQLALQLDLGQYLDMGKGEIQSGGRTRESNLADALEALLGAVYLDGGLPAAQAVFSAVFLPHIDHLLDQSRESNPKGTLLEATQKDWKKAPTYRTCSEKGPAHARVFSVEVLLDDRVLGRGTGSSKRQAETEAAHQALQRLEEQGEPDDSGV